MKNILCKPYAKYVLIHALFLFNSLGGIFSKRAAQSEMFSLSFFQNYFMILFILGVYAIFWQQILKVVPLTVATANKSATVIWGLVLGVLFFHEKISAFNVIGAVIIIVGICIFVSDDNLETADTTIQTNENSKGDK